MTLRGRTALLLGGTLLGLVAALAFTIFFEGRRSVAYLMASLFLVGACVAVVALLALERTVIGRITRLQEGLATIAGSGDLGRRLATDGSDEVGRLGEAVNRMLDALETSHQKLEESQSRLKDIVEHSTNLFYSYDVRGVLTYVSPQVRTFAECEPEEACVPAVAFLSDHADNVTALEAQRLALATGVRQPVFEAEIIGRRGTRRWVEVNEAPVVRDGRTVAVVGALTDITARKRAQEDKALLEEQLVQSQKMEAVGRLAGGVAHDFNNLLSVITGYGDMLLKSLPEGPQLKRTREIMKAAERASTLTRQLLTFSRKDVIEPQTIDLNRIVRDMNTMLRRLIGEDLELSTILEEDLPPILADTTRVEQVLMNLAVNARDAMPRGGKVTIKTSRVRLGAPREGVPAGSYVLLHVQDTGTGMDAYTRAHVFEPFFTTKEKGKGTGLGLATVYAIVQQCQGHIRVTSRLGSGTTFRIHFPEAQVHVSQSRAEAGDDPAEVWGGSETVLVVEDDEMVRALVTETLDDLGYACLEAPDPDTAQRICETHGGAIHLLLSDVVMPGMSGPTLAEALVRARPDMRVLLMSGYAADSLGIHGLSDTAANFLHKPFTAETLARRVRESLGNGGTTPCTHPPALPRTSGWGAGPTG